MPIFMNITSQAANGGTYTLAGKRLSFVTPANLPAAQEELWRNTTGISSTDWTSHFSARDLNLTMAVVANENDKVFTVSVSLAGDEPEGQTLTGFPKSSTGYLSMLYNLQDKDAGLMGANASSGLAARTGFIRKMMAGLQNFAETSQKVESVSTMSVGAGVYTWASYGATPTSIETAVPKLRQQWQRLAKTSHVSYVAPEIKDWIDRLSEAPTRETFRSIFVQAADDPCIAQSMKALLLGDLRFLDNPQHRYDSNEKGRVQYAMALNDDYRFYPQDPQFQAFFHQRLARLERN